METKNTELLKAVADVLEEALSEYEALSKFEMAPAEDPSKPAPAAVAPEAAPEAEVKPEEEKKEGEEDEEEEEKKDDEKEEEKEEDEETLKSEFAKLQAKMEARGLLNKSEEAVKAPEADKVEELKKSYDGQIESLTKTVAEMSEKLAKIAAQPVARKGVAGYAPLQKSEGEEQPLNKAETIDALLELKKSGKAVETALINRVETGRHTAADLKAIKGLLG